MAKFKKEKDMGDGWSRWVAPNMSDYKMACCDCGLVHDMEFSVVEVTEKLPNGDWTHSEPLDPSKYRVLFRVKRNNRSTGQLRRKLK